MNWIAALLFLPAIILRCFVLVTFWRWFVVFALGLPSIGIAQAIGLILIVNLVTSRLDVKRETRPAIEYVVISILGSLLSLAIGFVVLQFV